MKFAPALLSPPFPHAPAGVMVCYVVSGKNHFLRRCKQRKGNDTANFFFCNSIQKRYVTGFAGDQINRQMQRIFQSLPQITGLGQGAKPAFFDS